MSVVPFPKLKLVPGEPEPPVTGSHYGLHYEIIHVNGDYRLTIHRPIVTTITTLHKTREAAQAEALKKIKEIVS